MKRERLAGLLGALIVHLAAGIIFMSVKIGSLDIKKISREYEVILQDKLMAEEISESKPAPSGGNVLEQVLADDREMLNIARNLATRPDPSINPDDYLDKVKEEMIKSGQLGADNYIDEQKRIRSERKTEGVDLPDKQNKTEEEKVSEANEMASRYSGPTRIYYNLPGRIHVYLSIPVYKCEGGGKVTVAIEVTPKGIVARASVIAGESTTSDPCLTETAVSSSLASRFSPDASLTRNQTGTITFHFVPQAER